MTQPERPAVELHVACSLGDVGATLARRWRAVGATVRLARESLEVAYPHGFDLRVVDAVATPELAAESGVEAFPSLLRLWPPPVVAVRIGDYGRHGAADVARRLLDT